MTDSQPRTAPDDAMALVPSSRFNPCPGPVVTVILDGVGISPREEGDAVKTARTPTLRALATDYPMTQLLAHGKAVGMPSDDDMGNSEVGHNAFGAGRVFAQGAKLVADAINSGSMWEHDGWCEIRAAVQGKGTLHFIGLFSDGNVHSHIDHLKAMLIQAKQDGVRRARVHILLDGRDVGETSAFDYVDPFEEFLDDLRDDNFDVAIASGGGRMQVTMDRYEANWRIVELGWNIHVHGEGRQFASAHEAIEAYRSELGVIDQDLPGFVIARDGQPVGTIEDGDAVVFYNFRGDRAIEITRAFVEDDFDKFDGETWQEVLSDVVPFEQRPWMKAAEITDAMIAALQSGQYKLLRCNFANGDMVGHTGNFRAATMAVEAVDLALARLLPAIEAAGGVALITADHGNADEMFELDKKTKLPAQNKDGSFKAKTAHTLNPVPLVLFDKVTGGRLGLKQTDTAGLSSIAATVANLVGFEKHDKWDESVLVVK